MKHLSIRTISIIMTIMMTVAFITVPTFASDSNDSQEYTDKEVTMPSVVENNDSVLQGQISEAVETEFVEMDETKGDKEVVTENNVSSEEQDKEALIKEYSTTIAYVEVLENDASDMKFEEQKADDSVKELEKMNIQGIKNEIKTAIKRIAKNNDCYFLDSGVALVKEYCPELLNDIQTEEDLAMEDSITLYEDSNAESTSPAGTVRYVDGTSSASNTWAYRPLSGKPLIKETLNVKWTIKNDKITKLYTPTLYFTIDKRYYTVHSTTITKKSIASNKKSATIETKVLYKNKLSPFQLFHRHPSAKITLSGGAKFYQAKK